MTLNRMQNLSEQAQVEVNYLRKLFYERLSIFCEQLKKIEQNKRMEGFCKVPNYDQYCLINEIRKKTIIRNYM